MKPIIVGHQAFIETRYFGQTDHKPSRVKATNLNTRTSVTVSWDHSLDVLENHLAAASKLYEKCEIKVEKVVYSSIEGGGYVFTSSR
jgi:hypothetical protein